MQSFTVCPAPLGPQWVIVLPIASRIGRQRSSASDLPPTMIESVPAFAPVSPPETGASSSCTPRSDSRAPISRVTDGLIVLMSITTAPAASPPIAARSASPPGPSTSTSRTSPLSVTIVTSTSDASATARGDSAATAPSAVQASTPARLRFQTVGV